MDKMFSVSCFCIEKTDGHIYSRLFSSLRTSIIQETRAKLNILFYFPDFRGHPLTLVVAALAHGADAELILTRFGHLG